MLSFLLVATLDSFASGPLLCYQLVAHIGGFQEIELSRSVILVSLGYWLSIMIVPLVSCNVFCP